MPEKIKENGNGEGGAAEAAPPVFHRPAYFTDTWEKTILNWSL